MEYNIEKITRTTDESKVTHVFPKGVPKDLSKAKYFSVIDKHIKNLSKYVGSPTDRISPNNTDFFENKPIIKETIRAAKGNLQRSIKQYQNNPRARVLVSRSRAQLTKLDRLEKIVDAIKPDRILPQVSIDPSSDAKISLTINLGHDRYNDFQETVCIFNGKTTYIHDFIDEVKKLYGTGFHVQLDIVVVMLKDSTESTYHFTIPFYHMQDGRVAIPRDGYMIKDAFGFTRKLNDDGTFTHELTAVNIMAHIAQLINEFLLEQGFGTSGEVFGWIESMTFTILEDDDIKQRYAREQEVLQEEFDEFGEPIAGAFIRTPSNIKKYIINKTPVEDNNDCIKKSIVYARECNHRGHSSHHMMPQYRYDKYRFPPLPIEYHRLEATLKQIEDENNISVNVYQTDIIIKRSINQKDKTTASDVKTNRLSQRQPRDETEVVNILMMPNRTKFNIRQVGRVVVKENYHMVAIRNFNALCIALKGIKPNFRKETWFCPKCCWHSHIAKNITDHQISCNNTVSFEYPELLPNGERQEWSGFKPIHRIQVPYYICADLEAINVITKRDLAIKKDRWLREYTCVDVDIINENHWTDPRRIMESIHPSVEERPLMKAQALKEAIKLCNMTRRNVSGQHASAGGFELISNLAGLHIDYQKFHPESETDDAIERFLDTLDHTARQAKNYLLTCFNSIDHTNDQYDLDILYRNEEEKHNHKRKFYPDMPVYKRKAQPAFNCYMCDQRIKWKRKQAHGRYSYYTLYDMSQMNYADSVSMGILGYQCKDCYRTYEKFIRDYCIDVFFHNGSGYDFKLLMKPLARRYNLKGIAKTHEKFTSITATYDERYIDKKGKERTRSVKLLRFKDSYAFVAQPLKVCIENYLKNPAFKLRSTRYIIDNYYRDDLSPEENNEMIAEITSGKGEYPYQAIGGYEDLMKPLLPMEQWNNDMNGDVMTEERYAKVRKIWEYTKCRNMNDWTKLYMSQDVLLMSDFMEVLRKKMFSMYGLDPLHNYTAPGLALNAAKYNTRFKVQLFSNTPEDIEISKWFPLRGGVTDVYKRYAECDDNTIIREIDMRNLYGKPMESYLPTGNFKLQVRPSLTTGNPADDREFNKLINQIIRCPEDSPTGYQVVCDIEYDKEAHDYLSQYPPHPIHYDNKLCQTLLDKKDYAMHYRLFQLFHNLRPDGKMIIKQKVSRIISFDQAPILAPYIRYNTLQRNIMKSQGDKPGEELAKTCNNAVYGKTMENVIKRRDIRIMTSYNKADSIEDTFNKKARIYKNIRRYNDNLITYERETTNHKMDMPRYLGAAILDLSKVIMYNFFYNGMLKEFGNAIALLYSDTDSMYFEIKGMNDAEYERRVAESPHLAKLFCRANFPAPYNSNELLTTLGVAVDEPLKEGVKIMRFCALNPKVYCKVQMKIGGDPDDLEEINKLKGVRKYIAATMRMEKYVAQLQPNAEEEHCTMRAIRTVNFETHVVEENKIALTGKSSKRFIRSDNISTLPIGHINAPEGKPDPSGRIA